MRGYDRNISSNELHTYQTADERTVFLQHEAFRTDPHENRSVFLSRCIQKNRITDTELFISDLSFPHINGRCSKEFCYKKIDRVIIDLLRFSDLLDNFMMV